MHFLAALSLLWSAPADKPQFDVASIKPNPSPALRHVLLPPVGGHLSTRMAPLRLLVQNAYAVQSFQISGGPDWMNTVGYDIDAKAEGNPTRSQVWIMLQSLLESRFKLQVHREMKVESVFELTPAKGGVKISKSAETPCPDPHIPCGDATVAFDTRSGLSLVGQQIDMAELARLLSGAVQRPIIDKTGFTGKFDLDVPFVYEDDLTVGVAKPTGYVASGANLMSALQQKMGIKLESVKAPVEVLVVDHAERPAEN